jgi:flagellar biosynthesis/type III secretory pathway protein FliH
VALIKNANARVAARGAIVLDLGDLKRQGDLLRQAAASDADAIIKAAGKKREELIADASEEGRRRGFAQGLEEGRAAGAEDGAAKAYAERASALDAIGDRLLESVEHVESQLGALFVDARLDVIRLSVRLAEKIIKTAIDTDPTIVESQLEAVLSLLSRQSRLVVSVHPDDEHILRDAMPRLMARFASAAHIELTPDGSLSRASVVVRTEAGAVFDASIETQLQRMVATILPSTSQGPHTT